MAIHVDLSDLGTSHIDELLAKDLSEKMMDARIRLERAIGEKVLDLYNQHYSHAYIVRWQETEASTFRCMGQIFGPSEGKEAKALAAEKHGEIELVEFREAIPGNGKAKI